MSGTILRCSVLAAALAVAAVAQCHAASGATAAPAAPAVAAHVTTLQLDAVATDSVRFKVWLTLRANRSAAVSQIEFRDLRVNGLPVYARTLTLVLRLRQGQEAALPGPVTLQVMYRDLGSLQPLIDLLQRQRARVEGTVYLQANLNPLEMMLLSKTHAAVAAAFASDLPVDVPGGDAARGDAVAALQLANRFLQGAAQTADAALAALSQKRQTIAASYGPSLERVTASFQLTQGTQQAKITCEGLGLRIAAGEALAPRALLEPWSFDPTLAAAVQHGHWKVLPDERITVAPAGGGAPQPAQVARQARSSAHTVFVPGASGQTERIHVETQESAANVALLQWREDAPAPPAPRLDTSADTNHWDALAGFWLAPGGAPAMLFVGADRDGDGLRLATPVDASAWGGPLIGPEGVVGLIQSERAGIGIAAALAALGMAPNAPTPGHPAH